MEEPLRDSRTLAVQLRDRVADLIKDEGLQPGDKLPTEAQLTQRFKISRPALREALNLPLAALRTVGQNARNHAARYSYRETSDGLKAALASLPR